MSRDAAISWAIFAYGCLALLLTIWGAYELNWKIRSKRRAARKSGRHRP